MALTNGTTHASSDDHVASFWARYEHLKAQDVMKNVLMEVCFQRFESVALLSQRSRRSDSPARTCDSLLIIEVAHPLVSKRRAAVVRDTD